MAPFPQGTNKTMFVKIGGCVHVCRHTHIHAHKGKAIDVQFVYFFQRWSLINTVVLTLNHLRNNTIDNTIRFL